MKVLKSYDRFVFESRWFDTPEHLTEKALEKVKNRLEELFDEQNGTFTEMGLELNSSEFTKFNTNNMAYNLKYSDENFFYNLYVMVQFSDAIPTSDENDFTMKDIQQCFVKFKKYDMDDFKIVYEISENTELDKIDETYLTNLKIESDKDE